MKLSVAESGRHLVDDTGRPFFWLADTAWNTALRDDERAWERFLSVRQQQGFTVMQFVTTPWRGCKHPMHGPLFVEQGRGVKFEEHAWEKMEQWLGMIRDHGMVPAPVMIWDNNPDEAFFKFRPETCTEVGRRMLERWRKYDPVWILAGDGKYLSRPQLNKWKSIGRAVFAGYDDVLATMHPCGCSWVGDAFAEEPWYSLVGIQSGHGIGEQNLRFLTNGPYTTRWETIQKPFINLEPNYEFAVTYQDHNLRFGAYHVRRAAWWSVLGAPPAGLTYGSNTIWIWTRERFGRAEGHKKWSSGHWATGLETEGIDHLRSMIDILGEVEWWNLRPADHLLDDNPGWAEAEAYQKLAATPDRSALLVYTPKAGVIKLDPSLLDHGYQLRWVDPRTASFEPCPLDPASEHFQVQTPTDPTDRIDEQDWLLLATRAG